MKSEKLKVGGMRTIITVSRLVSKNGLDILIKAAVELKTIIPDSKFGILILGNGPQEKKLNKLARDLGVEDIIEFRGEVLPEGVPKFLREADIFVRPSRSEGLGSAFLEAMAAGLPIIGMAVGGIPDFLHPLFLPLTKGEIKRGSDGPNGLFAKVEDPKDLAAKIQMLLENPELGARLGENGRRLVEEKFNWDGVALKMNMLFENMLS